MARISVPYLTIRRGTGGDRYYWQPSSELRARGWQPVNYQKPVETAEGLQRLETEAEIIAHAKARNAALAETAAAAPAPARAATLADWMDQFLTDPRYFEPLSASAKRQYRTNFRALRDWGGDRRPGQIGPEDVLALFDAFREARGLRTAGAVVTSLKRLYNWAPNRGLAPKNFPNPAERLKIPTPPSRNVRWEDAEIEALIALCDAGTDTLDPDPDMGTAIAIAYYLGPRQGDMRRLCPAHRATVRGMVDGRWIERAGVELATAKTGERVAVPFHRALAARLDRLDREGVTPFVLTPGGLPYRERWFRARFALWRAALAGRAGFGAVAGKTFHDLRRSTVVKLAELNLSTAIIRAVTGHSTKTIETIVEVYLVRSSAMTLRAVGEWEAKG